jgi:hypothetical protein
MHARVHTLAREKGQIVKILCTELYQTQLVEIFDSFEENDYKGLQRFKTYLDTIIVNIPTKVEKYKQSQFFGDTIVQEIDHENFTIYFYTEKETKTFLILGIVKKS